MAAGSLALYALVIGAFAPSLLRRLSSSTVSPTMTVGLWLASAASMLAAALLSGLTAFLAAEPVHQSVLHLLRICADAFHLHYSDTSTSELAGLLAAVSLTGWCGVIGGITWWRARAERIHHRDLLDVVGRPDPVLGAVVLDHERAVAYCVPGSGGRIVVTSSLLQQLSSEELSAVLAHEHAHLAGHHHRLTGLVQALAVAFPFVPLCQAARTEVQILVEQLADETAAEVHDREVVAAALLRVSDSADAPSSMLAAGGSTAEHRALRLLHHRVPASAAARLLAGCAAAALALAPVAWFAITVVLAFADHCPNPPT
ncbi:M56 family metallopeptidase [Flindersiella endophytica]